MTLNIIRRPLKYTNYNAVYWLIGINVLIFAAMYFIGRNIVGSVEISGLEVIDRFGRRLVAPPDTHLPLTLERFLAMMPQAIIKNGAIWTFFTYMFMHANFTHILFNMLGLFIFGIHVEKQMGSNEFVLFYLVTGFLAGVFSFVMYYFFSNPLIPLVGASGALFAVQLAYAVFFPTSIIYIWGILPLRAPVMVLAFTVLSLFFTVTGTGGNVAHLTHLAGFAFAWLYFMLRYGMNPWFRLTGRYG